MGVRERRWFVLERPRRDTNGDDDDDDVVVYYYIR